MTFVSNQDPAVIADAVTVPNGSLSAAISIPAGTVQAWAFFTDNINIIVQHDGDAGRLEVIDNCVGWQLFPGEKGPPLRTAYEVKFQGDGATCNVTVKTTAAPA